MRLSKLEQRAHAAAMALVEEGRPLTIDEREQIMDDYREDAQHLNGVRGAYFTPAGLAIDFALHVPGGARVLDLCAGIGRLSWAVGFDAEQFPGSNGAKSIVCVEQNADYVRVGRRVLPRATWVCADVFDMAAYQHLGPFDYVIGNPPFGRIPISVPTIFSRYRGGLFEFHLIELATRLARAGCFILPQGSAPFLYSGQPPGRGYEPKTEGPWLEFQKATGIVLRPNCGVDTAFYRKDWHGTSPATEIVLFDMDEV